MYRCMDACNAIMRDRQNKAHRTTSETVSLACAARVSILIRYYMEYACRNPILMLLVLRLYNTLYEYVQYCSV